MAWNVKSSAFARKQLGRLNKPVAARIVDWIDVRIEECKNPRHFGEPLTGELSGLWRYRSGDFRAICEIHDGQLTVLALSIGHRRETHRKR